MHQNQKLFLFLLLLSIIVFLYCLHLNLIKLEQKSPIIRKWLELNETNVVWRRYNQSELSKLSKLGRILYADEPYPNRTNSDKVYKILMWKYGPLMEPRYIKQYGSEIHNPFETCSAKNCRITYSNSDLPTADLVLFHLHKLHTSDMPSRPNSRQIWTFSTDESPFHTFVRKRQNLTYYNNIFNWSLSYRKDSDIPVPYGRTIRQPSPATTQPLKRRDVLAAILGSNCKPLNHRWQYVHELQTHMQVDVYGACGTLATCPGREDADCPPLNAYLFYLAFENSNCDEYVTEKVFWNAYEKGAIPVVMGARRDDYEQMLPPNSYINVADFGRPAELADYLLHLNRTQSYVRYYDWRREYRVLNEHGYFGSRSYYYCRVCEALNYNDKRVKVYKTLESCLDKEKYCHTSWDEKSEIV